MSSPSFISRDGYTFAMISKGGVALRTLRCIRYRRFSAVVGVGIFFTTFFATLFHALDWVHDCRFRYPRLASRQPDRPPIFPLSDHMFF